jgi:polyisoprenoid-binding protein YceI
MLRTVLAAAAALSLAAAPAAFSQARGLSTNPADAPAGAYNLDKRHASLAVKVRHFGFSNYTFLMRGLDGQITYDPRTPTASKVSVTVDPTSVDTGLPDFDKEIGSDPRFFAAKPIRFVSRSLQQTGPAAGRLTGDLTLNGVTKPVTLDVTYNGGAPNMRGTPTLGFSAKGLVKRSDFNIATHLPGQALGDEVQIEIEAEFNKA